MSAASSEENQRKCTRFSTDPPTSILNNTISMAAATLPPAINELVTFYTNAFVKLSIQIMTKKESLKKYEDDAVQKRLN
jgi:hypothetical protein